MLEFLFGALVGLGFGWYTTRPQFVDKAVETVRSWFSSVWQ